MLIQVTQEHITKGRRRSSSDCPIACAVTGRASASCRSASTSSIAIPPSRRWPCRFSPLSAAVLWPPLLRDGCSAPSQDEAEFAQSLFLTLKSTRSVRPEEQDEKKIHQPSESRLDQPASRRGQYLHRKPESKDKKSQDNQN